MNSKKIMVAAGLCSLAGFATPVSAQIKAEAEQCLINDSSEQVHTLLRGLNTPNQTYEPQVKADFNRTMLACEQRYGWQRAQTIDAGAYAGFVLRFRDKEQAMVARGVSPSQLASLRGAAGLLFNENNTAMANWLRQNGYRSLAAFRSTNDFAYFDAWMGVLTAGRKLEDGKL
ncbi:hypothetical protein [Erythrobacter sp. HKB08]|uniref:hypothetical protein n=1 Tax=Erythrobacter sp. HKB08 TaxID=2502843 RepID=UPI001008B0A0|nr:hypothetical protein [Erythrobacter sp. HKB08]